MTDALFFLFTSSPLSLFSFNRASRELIMRLTYICVVLVSLASNLQCSLIDKQSLRTWANFLVFFATPMTAPPTLRVLYGW